MDKIDRIFQLHALFRSRRSAIPVAELLETLECSKATLHRSLNLLRDYLHAPLEFDEQAGGYRYSSLARAYELPGLWFSAAELQALVVLQRLLGEAGRGLLERQLAPLARRIEELTSHKRLNLSEACSRLRFPALAARPPGPDFERAVAATLQRRQLALHYHARGTDQHSDRVVSPQRIVHYREAWYLDGWDEGKSQLRTFSLDRVSSAVVLAAAARDLTEAELDAHYASAFGIFGGSPDKTARLRFSAERARWVADERWHPQQRSQHLPDGSYELEIPYRDPRELVMEILRHGPHVRVIAPESLAAEVRQQLARTLALYAAG